MKILTRPTPLTLADIFTYGDREWQVITTPRNPGLQGNLLKFKARSGILEQEFYLQLQ
jgi:hypothetical protein